MRQLITRIALLLGLSLAVAPATWAGDRMVVVELFTSQGCSSCPPADAFLTELSSREDVIPLALHVDYWDYIGWKDKFAQSRFTQRQKAYAAAAGRRSIYTPQMIVNGAEQVVGNHPKDVTALIARHGRVDLGIELILQRSGGDLVITAEAKKRLRGPVMVQLVRYLPEKQVTIRSGENAGRSLTYSNIVTSWQHVQDWDPAKPLRLRTALSGDEPVVVILQSQGPGDILAAARLR